jgi:hypothetical protein
MATGLASLSLKLDSKQMPNSEPAIFHTRFTL